MGADSKIQWTHHTFNPWWGCARVSPGCEHCYAEAFAKRTGKAAWGVKEPRRFFGDKHWAEPLKWDKTAEKAGERHRVFCASMADVFEDRRDLDAQRERLWDLIRRTPHLDWLLLTKRPENLSMLPWIEGFDGGLWTGKAPWRNAWLGTTVEDQKRADERIPHLLAAPAAVRFLSCEPLLEQVDLRLTRDIHWVIVGGESGAGSRPFALKWAYDIENQCDAVSAQFFMKQLGARPMMIDRQGGGFVPLELVDRRKGGDIEEWPGDLRVRNFPTVRT